MRRLLAVLFIISFVMPTGAGAHERVVLDPDDSVGPLDLVAARMQHGNGSYVLRAVTYEAWNDETISDDLDYVRFDLQSARGTRNRCVVVRLHPPEGEGPIAIEGTIYKGCNAPLPYSEPIGSLVGVYRPDAHSIEVTVARKSLWKRPPERLRWNAMTSYEDADYEGCEPPDPPPPEHFSGTCTDATELTKL